MPRWKREAWVWVDNPRRDIDQRGAVKKTTIIVLILVQRESRTGGDANDATMLLMLRSQSDKEIHRA